MENTIVAVLSTEKLQDDIMLLELKSTHEWSSKCFDDLLYMCIEETTPIP